MLPTLLRAVAYLMLIALRAVILLDSLVRLACHALQLLLLCQVARYLPAVVALVLEALRLGVEALQRRASA